MKTLVPWLLAISFGAAAVYLYTIVSAKDTELTNLHATVRDVAALHNDLESSRASLAVQEAELEHLRKENEEVLRLRNEVGELRSDKQQLTKVLASSQSASEAALQQAQQQAQALKAVNQQLQSTVKETESLAELNTCIKQLRLIDAAKQQWAVEQKKSQKDIPTIQDLVPYLKDKVMPECPSGGSYTLGTVEEFPACSIAGHALQSEAVKP